MSGDHLNYVVESRYYRFHIDCRYIVYLALVAIVTAIIAKLYRKGRKNAKISQMIQQKLCIQNWAVNLFPLDVKIA